MARRAAIPLPAPRSAAAGGRRSETRQEFSARSQSGTSRRSRCTERHRAVAVEPAIGARCRVGGRARGREPAVLASEAWLEAAARRAAVDPGSCRGKTSGAVQGRSVRHREGMGSRRTPKPVSDLLRAWRGMGGAGGRAGRRWDRAGSAPPLGLGSPRRPNLAGAAHGGCWMGLAGPEAWSRRKASLGAHQGFWRRAWAKATAEMSGPKRTHQDSARRLEILTGSGAPAVDLQLPQTAMTSQFGLTCRVKRGLPLGHQGVECEREECFGDRLGDFAGERFHGERYGRRKGGRFLIIIAMFITAFRLYATRTGQERLRRAFSLSQGPRPRRLFGTTATG